MRMDVYVCPSVYRLDGNVWEGHCYLWLCFIKVGCFINVVQLLAAETLLMVYNGRQPLPQQCNEEWAEVLSL
jgi:hypothetical protein